MGTQTRPRPGDKNKWPNQLEEVPVNVSQGLKNHSDNSPNAQAIRYLDSLRRVAKTGQRHTLFTRAVVTDEYLQKLSAAGLLKARTRKETDCHVNLTTGEIICDQNGQPHYDCQQHFCPYAALMRMRLVTRLRTSYALERRKHVGQ